MTILRFFNILLLILFMSSFTSVVDVEANEVLIQPESLVPVMVRITHPDNPYEMIIPGRVKTKTLDKESTIKVIDLCYEPTETPFEKKFCQDTETDVCNSGEDYIVDNISGETWRYEDVTTVVITRKPDCEQALLEYEKTLTPIAFSSDLQVSGSEEKIILEKPDSTPQKKGVIETLIYKTYALQIKKMYGLANVKSFIETDGRNDEVANGDAKYEGFEISFQRPNVETGWSYSLSPQYMNQSITISDFREKIPEVDVSGKENILVEVTNFNTDEVVDLQDPNRYDIHLSSYGFIAETQYHWAKSCTLKKCQFFGEITAGLGALKYQKMRVDLGSASVEDNRWKTIDSYYMILSAGVIVPSLSSAIQLQLKYLHYPSLSLPQSIEFRDKVAYNENKQIFERKRVFLGKVELDITTIQLAYTFYFN